MQKQLILALTAIVFSMVACNAPGTAEPAGPTETAALPPSPTLEPTPTLAPADLPFTIDCGALDPSRQPDCDAYIAATRDQVYPILREITGVPLSTCYDEIHYTIVVGDAAQGAGGFAAQNNITFSQTYSIDLPHRYDVHELLHSTSQCSGALDGHVFHGLIMNYVYDRLGVRDEGYFTDQSNPQDLNDYLLEAVETSGGEDLYSQCRGILANQMTILYFDLAAADIQALYRSTISAVPQSPPGQAVIDAWGGSAEQVQVLVETLERDYKYPLDVPACGY